MQCTMLSLQRQHPIAPKQYLPSNFKVYVLEYLLQRLINNSTRVAYEAFSCQGRGYKSHHYEQNRVVVHTRQRTQADSDTGNLSIDLSRLTEQYESPYRTKEKTYKTQYFRPSSPSFNDLAPDLMNISSQEYFKYHEAAHISPYQKKQNAVFMETNERLDSFGQRSRVSLHNEGKIKRIGAILAWTTIKYQIYKREVAFFRSIERCNSQAKELEVVLGQEKQKNAILARQEERYKLQQKLSIFINLNAVYKYLIKRSFQSLKQFQPEEESEGEQYTIVYVKDEVPPKSSIHSPNPMKIALSSRSMISKPSSYSHRSDKPIPPKAKE